MADAMGGTSWKAPDSAATWVDGDSGLTGQSSLSNTPPKQDDDEDNGDGNNS
jgi:hypothetical protein